MTAIKTRTLLAVVFGLALGLVLVRAAFLYLALDRLVAQLSQVAPGSPPIGVGPHVVALHEEVLRDTWSLAVPLVLLLLVGGILTLRWLERPLQDVIRHTNRIVRGERGRIEIGGVEETRLLGAALNEMSERLADERERQRQFTELAVALSAGGDVPTIARNALDCLVGEGRGLCGSLFVAADEAASLKLVANRGKGPLATHTTGEALVREARVSNRTLFIEDARLDPLGAGTEGLEGIGSASLLIAPLRAASKVVGVIELAGSLDARNIPQIERGLSRVGLALQNALDSERMRRLRDELAVANDQLVLHNEELRAQEDELRRQGDELLSQQAQLITANAELVRASQLKSEFLSSMSHELRTPLNAVIGFADVLLTGIYGEISPDQRDAIADILAAGRQLLALVNDVLDLSKIEAGRLEVRVERVDLTELAAEACTLLDGSAERKGIALHNEIQDNVWCTADRDRVRQVLVNLLSNAVKFTPEGGTVTLAVCAEQDALQISVSDTGIGISPEDAPRLFQPFSQLDPNRPGGTGLGLSICKRLVELMGGAIGFTSAPSQGSHFFFTLPTKLVVPSTRPSAPPRGLVGSGRQIPSSIPVASRSRLATAPSLGAKVLVIDDSEVNRRVVRAILAPAGYDVLEAADAQFGLSIAREHLPSVILMDVRMPDMDGLEATIQLAADPTTQHIPVVVISAQAMAGDRERALAAGCVAYVAKPISRQELLTAVHGALSVEGSPREDAAIA
jgi:signal transduction histidine kinase/ActR/RegA family two-component response regulator